MMEFKSKFFNAFYNNEKITSELCETDFEKYLFNKLNGSNIFDVKFSVRSEFLKDFDKYVPSVGKAQTVYGEILRGINKLIYRLYNDGDDMQCGPYSGIWIGFKDLECPFTYDDCCVRWKSYEYDAFNQFNFARDMEENMMMNTLILKEFEFDKKDNWIDISSYYKNITEFFVESRIAEKFKEHDLDLTDNMGMYNQDTDYGTFEINSIAEDLYIKFKGFRNQTIEIDFSFGYGSLKLEFEEKDIDEVLTENEDILKVLFRFAQYDFRKSREDFIKAVEEVGYKIEERKIVKNDLLSA